MNNLNPAELGAFSEFVYKDTAQSAAYPARIPQGYRRVATNPDTANGFYASAFYNPSIGQLVVAYRGTDDLQDWLKSNPSFLSGSGSLPKQFGQAKAFLDAARARVLQDFDVLVDNSNIVLTGHSLGGGLAAMVSVVTGIEAAAFNAPKMNRPGIPGDSDF